MKPAAFEYHAPETVADAVGVLAEHADEAKPLAGGQSLVPMLALRLTRFAHLVDLNRVDELTGIRRDDGALVIGAMTRQRAVERDPDVASAAPLLAASIPLIGHSQIRNRGTVGGSIAHADPASELPAVALALDADLEIASKAGTRTVPATEFFEGTWTTCLADEELLTAIRFPLWEGRCGFAFDEVARRSGDFALAGVAVAVEVDGAGAIRRAALGLLGLGSTPRRAPAAEAALMGRAPTPHELEEIAQLAVADLEPPDDIHATATYRRRVGAHLVGRSLGRALEEATNG
ncbi:MAG TPA: xanthine dehydrogenase family protein subunit M [Acidimicrobiia bacterium]|nr:xanthine dehydrogenase family protein subunit M [Acidimicrobiia bacterium]